MNGAPGGAPFNFMGDQGGFDFGALQNVLNDPSIKQMAEQLAQDPAFAQMSAALQSSMQGAGGQERAAPPGSAPSPADMDPTAAASAMSEMFQNPQFMQMAQGLGQKIMEQDPGMQSMMQTMESPDFRATMEKRLGEMKEDPEVSKIMADIEQRGPAAMMNYWSDPVVLEKMSKVMGDVFNKDEGAAGLADGDAADEEEAAEDEPITLHSCARDGEVSKLKELLAAEDVDVDEKDEEGRTALQFACGFGELECAEALVEAKADIEATDNNTNTALHYAAGYGQEESSKLLLKHKAKQDIRNMDDRTPRMVCDFNGHTELLGLFDQAS